MAMGGSVWPGCSGTSGDPDDDPLDGNRPGRPHALHRQPHAQRLTAAGVLRHERLADDADLLTGSIVVRFERATAEEGNAEDVEIARSDDLVVRRGTARRLEGRVADDLEPLADVPPIE